MLPWVFKQRSNFIATSNATWAPQWWWKVREILAISGNPRLVKYYHLARNMIYFHLWTVYVIDVSTENLGVWILLRNWYALHRQYETEHSPVETTRGILFLDIWKSPCSDSMVGLWEYSLLKMTNLFRFGNSNGSWEDLSLEIQGSDRQRSVKLMDFWLYMFLLVYKCPYFCGTSFMFWLTKHVETTEETHNLGYHFNAKHI